LCGRVRGANVSGNKARGAKQTGNGDYRVGLNQFMYGTHMRETALFTRASYSPEAHGRGLLTHKQGVHVESGAGVT